MTIGFVPEKVSKEWERKENPGLGEENTSTIGRHLLIFIYVHLEYVVHNTKMMNLDISSYSLKT